MPGLSEKRTPKRIFVILTKIPLLWRTATNVAEDRPGDRRRLRPPDDKAMAAQDRRDRLRSWPASSRPGFAIRHSLPRTTK
jgi:hypothetical protein